MTGHLIDGEFQSDKYPTTPRGKVPLSCKDPMAQELLWQYAQRRREEVDAEFAGDLEAALRLAGFDPSTYEIPAHGWTCFHCGETFLSPRSARWHFGADALADPACRIKAAEGGLVKYLRALEEEAARYREEDSDLHREIARLGSEHADARRREEEKGFASGCAGGRERALRLVGDIKRLLTHRFARAACDAIAASIADPQVD